MPKLIIVYNYDCIPSPESDGLAGIDTHCEYCFGVALYIVTLFVVCFIGVAAAGTGEPREKRVELHLQSSECDELSRIIRDYRGRRGHQVESLLSNIHNKYTAHNIIILLHCYSFGAQANHSL